MQIKFDKKKRKNDVRKVFGLQFDTVYIRREQFNRMMKECHVAYSKIKHK